MPPAEISPAARVQHLAWLLEVTQIPTAAGREQRVIRWVERWAAARPALELTRDRAGNVTIAFTSHDRRERPVYFTAHLDHPAFVVERIVAPQAVELSFRGGVMDDYFTDAPVAVHDRADRVVRGRLTDIAGGAGAGFKHYLAELDEPAELSVGDVAVWDLPPGAVIDGNVHTLACDDLAALAAALAAMDVLVERRGTGGGPNVRLLFTRAEEVGFIGAIAACRHGTVPRDARVIALENSRSFAESPIGGGPIVRVGDRLSVFSPTLTEAVAKRAEEIAGGPASVTASQKLAEGTAWKWQRKLMAGGACEASVFCHAGYEATCVCLPLGNYHNMGDLAAVQAGTNTRRATIEREFIAVSDFEGLVDLLVACGESLPGASGLGTKFDKLWDDKKWLLD